MLDEVQPVESVVVYGAGPVGLWDKAPDAYQHFDARENGWTKIVLKPAA